MEGALPVNATRIDPMVLENGGVPFDRILLYVLAGVVGLGLLGGSAKLIKSRFSSVADNAPRGLPLPEEAPMGPVHALFVTPVGPLELQPQPGCPKPMEPTQSSQNGPVHRC